MKVVLRSAIAIIYISSFLVMLHNTTFAQAPEIQWKKTIGRNSSSVGYSVQQTADGGYIIVGETRSSDAGNISQIAYNCGFSNPSYFAEMFGLSPIEYINKLKM